jgi:hypothetical protein
MVQMSPAITDTLVIEVLIAFVILGRSIRTYYGRTLSVPRLLLFPVLATVLWIAAEASTAYSIPSSFPIWTGIDAALVVVGALVTLPLASRLIRVYQGPDGQWMYRYGIELIAFYLTSWVVRLALAAYFDPSSLEFTYTTGPPLSAVASLAMQVVQILFSLSTGLLIGRTAGTIRLYRAAVPQSNIPAEPLP